MNRTFAISAVVMFVMAVILGFLAHGVLLHDDYARLPNVMRPESEVQTGIPLMAFAYVCFALAFTWIYRKGQEDKFWLAQGLRYGIAVALLTAVPTYLTYHVVAQFPFDLAVKQIVLDAIILVLMGIVLAWLNRNEAAVFP
jgi:preprotein translocase subunit SecG